MNNTTFEEDEAFVPQVLPDYIAWTSLVLCSIILAVGVLGTTFFPPFFCDKRHAHFNKVLNVTH